MTDTRLIAVSATLLLTVLLWLRSPSKAKSKALPPGPKPLPVVGNIKDLTTQELWLPAFRWAKQYGDVVYLHVFGQGLVFLNSPKAAFDLLDKRGSIYSDKPQLVMTGELCGCKNMVAFTSYGEQSKRQRRLLHKAFGIQAIPSYHPLLHSETLSFLQRLLHSPSAYKSHIRRYAGGLTLSVVYGYQANSNADPFLLLAEECVDLLANHIASGGGIWPVDIFPFLKYLPTWMPGAGFKRKAEKWKSKMEEFVEKPYEFVKNSMKRGEYIHSFCSSLLEEERREDDREEFEFDLKWTANSMYSASADTTITTVSHFLLAMMLYPETLAKARAELDSVVGTDRLPTLADMPSLPYVQAVIEETYRWGVPVPLSLPHRLMEDDVYGDVILPKGSLVFANVWAILRDESIYPDPETFNPDRFMESSYDQETRKRMDPRNYVFGFGRRRCPGENLVEYSIWLLIANIIATMDISKAKDPETGKMVEPEVKFENPIFRTPSTFKIDIRPRSEKALELIRQAELAL